jgi:hypothetical protein
MMVVITIPTPGDSMTIQCMWTAQWYKTETVRAVIWVVTRIQRRKIRARPILPGLKPTS